MLAPTGRDAPLTVRLLSEAGLSAHACRDIEELCTRSEQEGAAGLLVAEEVLVPAALARLGERLAAQPSWSDLPVLIFTSVSASARMRPSSEHMLATLGNVTLLDRPLRPIAMVSAARSALRARRRQYAARAELREQQRAVHLRDQFLAMLGHELRNPLSAILMALELDGDGEGHGRKHREIVRRQAKHLARLVDDLLDVARVTSGKIALRREDVDLVKLAERCVHALAPLAASHEQTLTFRATCTDAPVRADPVRIEQVLVNLVTNATKYTPAGGHITVEVSASADQASVTVCDDGVGISAEMLPHVFDLFTQVESSLARADGGMGIGLTLVRSLVELHGGEVDAESAGAGKGSTFVVRLPRAKTRSQSVPAAPAVRSPTQSLRVLVIEDNEDSRILLAMLLGRRGHQVTTAADGPSGVAEALALRPDVLVVDIGLPGLDGYGVAREIRRALGSEVTLIALTGYGQPDDRARALAAGFDVHLTKPLDVAAVDALLDRRQPSAS